VLWPKRDGNRDLDPTAFSASTASATVIFTTVGVVIIDVTVIVVITATMNNLSELAMKQSCVEAPPGGVRYLHLTCASLVSCERVDRADDNTFRPRDTYRVSLRRSELMWICALAPSLGERSTAKPVRPILQAIDLKGVGR
jgi:hypothetical protein